MYSSQNMNSITGFASHRQYPDMPSVEDIAKALTVHLELAENLFSRRAKTMLRAALQAVDPRLSDSSEACPAWVVQSSVTINILMLGKVRDDLVDRAIQRVSDAVLQEVEVFGMRPVLLGAMSTRIHPIGGDTFNFVLKQKFTVGASTEEDLMRFFGSRDG